MRGSWEAGDEWLDLESVIENEVSQKEKNKYHINVCVCVCIYIYIYIYIYGYIYICDLEKQYR